MSCIFFLFRQSLLLCAITILSSYSTSYAQKATTGKLSDSEIQKKYKAASDSLYATRAVFNGGCKSKHHEFRALSFELNLLKDRIQIQKKYFPKQFVEKEIIQLLLKVNASIDNVSNLEKLADALDAKLSIDYKQQLEDIICSVNDYNEQMQAYTDRQPSNGVFDQDWSLYGYKLKIKIAAVDEDVYAKRKSAERNPLTAFEPLRVRVSVLPERRGETYSVFYRRKGCEETEVYSFQRNCNPMATELLVPGVYTFWCVSDDRYHRKGPDKKTQVCRNWGEFVDVNLTAQ